MTRQGSAFWRTVAAALAAGLATAVIVEVVVLVRGYLGVRPSNVAGHLAFVWAVSAVAGAVIGVRLAGDRMPVGKMLGMAGIATVVWLVGIGAAEMAWTLGGELLVGGERGMNLLNIPYLGAHGALPLLAGMLLAAATGVVVGRRHRAI